MLGLAVVWGGLVEAQERVWDHARARERVEKVLKVEAVGQPWNGISWWTDAALAEAHARKTGKPIFVFLYVNEGGPAPEPC